ncbi:MAG: CorA family divalent cation transporter [Pirellulaceae bacterium]
MPELLPPDWNIPEIFRQRLGIRVGQQRVMSEDGHLLLVLHAVPAPDQHTRDGCFFWRAPDGVWKSNLAGEGIKALEGHLINYREKLEELESLDEAASTAEDYFDVLERLAPIQRSGGHLLQVLSEVRKLVRDDRDLINMRDKAYDLNRTCELLFSSAKNALDFQVARQSEYQSRASHQMSVSAHRLNVMASIFFPIATLTAIFSTNFESGLRSQLPQPWPFLALVGVGMILGCVLTVLVTRRAPEQN